MEAKTFIPTHRMTEVNRLLDELLAEPFAGNQKIEDATLESVQASFEEIDEAFADGMPPPELADLRDSYTRSKDLFCLILMELEAMGATGNETLHELRHSDAGTQFVTPAALESSRAQAAAPTLTLVPPPPTEEELAEVSANWEEAANLWDTHAEADETLNQKQKLRPTPPPAPAFYSPPPVQKVRNASVEEEIAPEIFETIEEDVEEVTVLKSIHEKSFEMAEPPPRAPVPPPAPVAEVAPVVVAPVATTPVATALNEKTEEYLEHAEKFQQAGLDQFEAQCRLFAVECELWARLRPAVQLFWTKKESAIREILDSGNKRFDLHPVLKKGLEGLAKEGKDFLPAGGLPYPALLNSVRFMLSSPLWDAFWPLPVELGMLALFFGSDRTMRGLVLRNHLQLKGLGADEGLELSFRLFRCQTSRNRVLTPAGEAPDLETIRRDTARLVELTKKLGIGSQE